MEGISALIAWECVVDVLLGVPSNIETFSQRAELLSVSSLIVCVATKLTIMYLDHFRRKSLLMCEPSHLRFSIIDVPTMAPTQAECHSLTTMEAVLTPPRPESQKDPSWARGAPLRFLDVANTGHPILVDSVDERTFNATVSSWKIGDRVQERLEDVSKRKYAIELAAAPLRIVLLFARSGHQTRQHFRSGRPKELHRSHEKLTGGGVHPPGKSNSLLVS